MADGTAADYAMLTDEYNQHAESSLVPGLLATLESMKGPKLGYQIDRFDHSLQSATRALRNEESNEMVVAALLHDIGDVLAPHNHSNVAAAILAPYVSDKVRWIIAHHGVFQGYYYFHHLGGDRDAREQFVDSPHYDACVDFCANYDQNCFDPNYDNMALGDFKPLVYEVFGSPMPEFVDSGAGNAD